MTKDLNRPGYRGRVSENGITIAEVLKTAGYRSFLAGKWHLGTADPTKHGFEEFYGTLASAKTFWNPDHYLRLPKGRKPRQYPRGKFYGTDALTDHALDFLAKARSSSKRPWFLYLAYNAPHFPLQAPKETIAKYTGAYHKGWDQIRSDRHKRMKQLGIIPNSTPLTPRSRYFDWGKNEPGANPAWKSLSKERRADLARRMAIYAAMVDRMDQNVGRVIAALKQSRELDNTLIVFTSDNGACAEWDPFGFDIRSGPQNVLHRGKMLDQMGSPGTFHSTGSGWANASNTPWRLYKHYNHEGGIASPCIVHWPAKLKRGGAVIATPAHLIDLMPTFVDAAAIKYPERLKGKSTLALPGKSLMPLLQGRGMRERALFFEHEGNRAIREGNWKLVALRGKAWELYDLTTDRAEMTDVCAKHPDLARRLARAWEEWAKAQQVTPLPQDYGVKYVPIQK